MLVMAQHARCFAGATKDDNDGIPGVAGHWVPFCRWRIGHSTIAPVSRTRGVFPGLKSGLTRMAGWMRVAHDR